VENLLVPSSIQRVRSFLVEMCGMKVKPWADAEETLSALHATLVARSGCDIFWTSLRVLLETLARDLKTRQEAAPGTLVDNEVLDGDRFATLLNEIRAALGRQGAETTALPFRRLAAHLSAPALGLLLFLGGAATVGCSREPLSARSHDGSVQVSPDAQVSPDSIDSQPETTPDSSLRIQLPEIPRALPDTRPASDLEPAKDATTIGPDGGIVTIQDIMDSCNIPSQQQGMVLACLEQLKSSWRDGIASALSGQDCGYVDAMLNCNPNNVCSATYYSNEFDPKYPRLCQPVLVYIGVRFI